MIFNDFKGEGSIMRKKLAVASFAAFLAAASLTACGSSKDAQTTAAQTEVQTEAAETEVQEEKTETEASADDRAYKGTTLNVMAVRRSPSTRLPRRPASR